MWLDGAVHAETVNDHWKYKSGTSLGFVRAMLATDQCPCVGVEVAAGAGRGGGAAAGSAEAADVWELVSWCCTYPYGAHGMLGTAEALELDLVLCSPLSRAIATAVDGLLLPPLPPPDAARPALGLGVVGRHPVEVRAGLGRIIFRSVPPFAHTHGPTSYHNSEHSR